MTNLEKPACAAAEGIYKRAIAYAIAKLSLPNAFLYVDAAHAGWLGWPRNLVKSLAVYKEVLAMAGGPERIRGFATDVSNYDPSKDPTAPKRDPAAAPNDELGYVADLAKGLPTVGITGKGFVIDTGRDGVPNVRTAPGNWCNIKGAGLGERPQAAPAPQRRRLPLDQGPRRIRRNRRRQGGALRRELRLRRRLPRRARGRAAVRALPPRPREERQPAANGTLKGSHLPLRGRAS